MTTKTKKKSTKVKAKAKATKAAPKETTSTRRSHDREALMPQVVELRDDGGLGWAAIAEQLDVDAGLARLLYMTAKVKPKDRIKGDEDDIAAGIIEARDELSQSWGLVAARCRLPESKVRNIYAEATGNDHKQGYKVVQDRVAAKGGTTKATKTKAKSTDEKRDAAKAKKKATAKSRKAKTGSANPS